MEGGGVKDVLDAEDALTTSEYTGEMTITRFDMEEEIVSGTFWFDVQDPKTGETREVRDGRFDVIANF